jgi:L-ascorbate metabolism protein UlaG (beta-lactamase superfamily)
MHPFAALEVPRGSVGVHWFEQNAYALKDSRGTTVLVDPYFPHERPPERFIRPTPPVVEADLPTDWVLVTHAHSDHTCAETIGRIHDAWPGAKYVGPQDAIAKILSQTAVDPAHTLLIEAGESIDLVPADSSSASPALTVHAYWSKPPGGDPAAGIPLPNAIHLGYVVEMGGLGLYFTGDLINNYADHDELIAPIAARQLDVGFLTTHPTEGEFPFFEGSIRLAQKLGLQAAVPAHYACFAKRTYDPQEWAALFPVDGPKPLIIPWNTHILYP